MAGMQGLIPIPNPLNAAGYADILKASSAGTIRDNTLTQGAEQCSDAAQAMNRFAQQAKQAQGQGGG